MSQRPALAAPRSRPFPAVEPRGQVSKDPSPPPSPATPGAWTDPSAAIAPLQGSSEPRRSRVRPEGGEAAEPGAVDDPRVGTAGGVEVCWGASAGDEASESRGAGREPATTEAAAESAGAAGQARKYRRGGLRGCAGVRLVCTRASAGAPRRREQSRARINRRLPGPGSSAWGVSCVPASAARPACLCVGPRVSPGVRRHHQSPRSDAEASRPLPRGRRNRFPLLCRGRKFINALVRRRPGVAGVPRARSLAVLNRPCRAASYATDRTGEEARGSRVPGLEASEGVETAGSRQPHPYPPLQECALRGSEAAQTSGEGAQGTQSQGGESERGRTPEENAEVPERTSPRHGEVGKGAGGESAAV